ncbi:hypothetical protein NIES4071_94260 [Calothrix sp. NIES-4071]|nr:hypothetical protein NIES4071_94260 [Calothrix sp. NIES-4071]BAZ63691.1 hypothetical protein NIES4105_94190 [Calothrix sp. NIES-4105]
MALAYPVCWRIIKRDIYSGRAGWGFERPKFLANITDVKTPENFNSVDWENFFGTTKSKVVTELFRINGGKPGYYLANLLEHKYYYCGESNEDLRIKFLELGIGSVEPS